MGQLWWGRAGACHTRRGLPTGQLQLSKRSRSGAPPVEAGHASEGASSKQQARGRGSTGAATHSGSAGGHCCRRGGRRCCRSRRGARLRRRCRRHPRTGDRHRRRTLQGSRAPLRAVPRHDHGFVRLRKRVFQQRHGISTGVASSVSSSRTAAQAQSRKATRTRS